MTRRRILLVTLATLAVVLLAAGGLLRSRLASLSRDVVPITAAPEYQSTELLDAAWALPAAATFRQQVDYQPNGSICGPTSLANVFRSLGEGPVTPKAVIEGTGKCGLFDICFLGLTLDELADVARSKTGRKITVLRDLTLDAFERHLVRSNDPAVRYVANFSRGPLFGEGGGHHSPIGGYLADRDLVLVLDVNAAFKPWLVASERLFRAVDTVDSSSGKKRGLLLVE